ncbi:hypothetical protein TTHERM_00678330 (macronuclear) [Tetrahymena thermophila SB210]|uniref:Uncharacterized protein n=1 Tax=Tetrahymena thermophila (strain SB210) TaxID=312017 RepID=I7M4L1_TETTS|nr:hypothetical protein TTHERM_00678330 [Tetrahymena thermophila SB210]EAS07567.2 hypothetical protein TTHERM_00678330 [Tetrahymena thermophila SB210]|eukprot:XP_001027809.2 hypothetical protein TTHERM_00678330 [Tetrahymena thermophila SB210]
MLANQYINNSNSARKKKKIYLDYNLVSPTYQNHELFKSPHLYSARNSTHQKLLKQSLGHNANQAHSYSLNNSPERSRDQNAAQQQIDTNYDTNRLRRALYGVNLEQGMLVDSINVDKYKKRKKSIPTVEQTSQYQIEQALQYYSQSHQQRLGQNQYLGNQARQSRIIGNPYNQPINLSVQASYISDQNYLNGNKQSYSLNKSLNQSNSDGKGEDTVNLTNRQQIRNVFGKQVNYKNMNSQNNSQNNISPFEISQDYNKSQNQYLPITKAQKNKNKSNSVYSAVDIFQNAHGQSSATSFALDSPSEKNLKPNEQQKKSHLQQEKNQNLGNINCYSSNKTIEKIFKSSKNTEKNLSLIKNQLNGISNFSLEPIQQTNRQKDMSLDLIRNSSLNQSPSLSPKIKYKKNRSIEKNQDNQQSPKSKFEKCFSLEKSQDINVSLQTLAQNSSIAQLIQREKPHALTLPKLKVIVLDMVNNYEDIDQKFIKIDIEKYWLSLLNKSVRLIADYELMTRLQPYIIDILQSDYYLKYRTNQLSGKYQLKEISKWNFLKEIQSYEKLEIAQNKFYEFIIYYFIPSQDYREQLIKDLTLAINQKIQKQFPFAEDINTLMDINGNIINDLYEFNISQKVLLAGNLTSLITLYPSFQKHLQQYNKNAEKISFIQERKKNFQQAFVVLESSPQLNTLNPDSPQQNKKQLKLPQILRLPPSLTTQDSVCSLNSPQKKSQLDSLEVQKFNHRSTQKKLETRNMSLISIPEFNYNSGVHENDKIEQKASQIVIQTQRKIVIKKEQKNSLYLTKGDIQTYLKQYEKLSEKDILNFHAEFKQLVSLNSVYEEKANIGINSRLKKPFRDYLVYTQIFFSMNPSFQDKERQYQTQIFEALQIEINIGDHQHPTLGWKDFLLIKTCVANLLTHDQKIGFLQRFFNKYNMIQITKQEFYHLLASARGIPFNESSEKLILHGFQEEIWSNLNELSLIDKDNFLIQKFFYSINPNCRLLNDLIQWMFLQSYE